MASLEGVLAAIPGYGGYLAQRQQNEQAGAQELQQFGAVQGVLANLAAQQQKQAELKRQEQYRAELAANPEKAQEIALKYGSPDKVLDVQTRIAEGAENRNARMQERVLALDAAAANAALSREERAARAAEAADLRREIQAGQQAFAASQSRNAAADRENLVRVTAGLRPEPAVTPIYERGADGNTVAKDARTGRVLSTNAVFPGQLSADARRLNSIEDSTSKQYNAASKPSREILGAADTYRAIRGTGDTPQAAVFAAEVLQRAIRSGNARFKAEADKILGGGYRGGSIDERLMNFGSQLATGTPTQKTMADLDKLMDVVEGSAMQQIANQAKFFGTRLNGNKSLVNALGKPFVQGTHVVTPKGEYRKFPTPEAAAAAAEKWLEENQ